MSGYSIWQCKSGHNTSIGYPGRPEDDKDIHYCQRDISTTDERRECGRQLFFVHSVTYRP